MADRCVVLLVCCMIVVAGVGCSVLDPGAAHQRNTQQMNANQELAIDIINALAEYHQSVGGFPGSLEHLVPAYLPTVPETVAGESFTYYPDDLRGYSLCFYLPGDRDRGCCFHQYVFLWECSNP
jgi:hypothetical protein